MSAAGVEALVGDEGGSGDNGGWRGRGGKDDAPRTSLHANNV